MPFASDGQTEISVSETGRKVMLTVRDTRHPVFHYGLLPAEAANLGRDLLRAAGKSDPARDPVERRTRMATIEIKHRFGDSTVWEGEASDLREAVIKAVRANVDLSGANLDGANLIGASLDGASLIGASLDGASLIGASLDGASLI